MQWTNLDDFFRMGGYAFYVWGSFGLTALVFIVEPLLLKQRQTQARRAVQREQRAECENENPV